MNKVLIYGMGAVGKNLLLTLCLKEELIIGIYDKNKDVTEATILDFLPFNNTIINATNQTLKDYDDLFLTVGIPYMENRSRFLKESKKMIDCILEDIINRGFKGNLIIISNPTDVLCSYVSEDYMNKFKNIVSTGTIIDTMRLSKITGEKHDLYGPHGHRAILLEDTKVKKEDLVKALDIGYKITNLGVHSAYGICIAAYNLFKTLKSHKNEIFIASFYNKKLKIAFSHKLLLKNGIVSSVELEDFKLQYFKKSIEVIFKELMIFKE